MTKVLIVEDSLVVREFLTYILSSDPEIDVIGAAKSGEEALEFLERKKPDVITMDINMPKMDGFEATRIIMETHPTPIVIVSASWDPKEVEKTFRATEAGAVAALEKPRGIGHANYENTARELVQTVKAMSEVKVVRRWKRNREARAATPGKMEGKQKLADIKLVAMGASTGGPPVLQDILSSLSKDFPVPVLMVQHIAAGFLPGLADWLTRTTGFPVQIAVHGEDVLPGRGYIAPDDLQMGIKSYYRIALDEDNSGNGLRPSISYLFSSVADAFGENAVGVLLTGMGKDGAKELKLMKEKGAITIAQDEESSVIHGMPGEAIRLGATMHVLPPDRIAATLEALTARNKPTSS